jgi:YidC/Oxa1 family membrane protein insertase
MDRNQIIGTALIIGLVVVWATLFRTTEEPVQAENSNPAPTEQTENTPADTQNVDPSSLSQTEIPDSARAAMEEFARQNEHGVFAPASVGTEELISLKNNKLKVELSTKGGMFYSAELTEKYKSYWDSVNIQLWEPEISTMSIAFDYKGKGTKTTSQFFFTPEVNNAVAAEGNPAFATMRLNTTDPGKYLEFTYSLPNDSYEIVCDFKAVGLYNEIDLTGEQTFDWLATGISQEKGKMIEMQRSSVFYREDGEDRDYLSENTDDFEKLEQPLHWMAFKQNYFSALVINDDHFKIGAEIGSKPVEEADSAHTMMYAVSLPFEWGSDGSLPLRFFMGPNDYRELKKLETEEVGRIIDYGWSLFGWVNRNMIRPVFNWLNSFNLGYGIVIIILTVLIKLLLFPVTWKNYFSSAKMRVLRPEIDEINKKFEGKPAAEKQQATMALYKQTGVNPFAGCLPVLLQMPILYAMFRFFPASIELRGEGFLWADDLGAYDSILDLPWDIPLYGDHVSGFTLLMAISTFFYTRMSSANMPNQSQPGMPNMKLIMNIFPFMMLFFFNNFASGLSFYYFLANVMSIGQMLVIKRWFINEDKIRAKIEDNKKKPKKKSSFQSRLEEVQKAQQQKLKDKKGKK